MELLRNLLLVLHFVGLAAILGGVLAQIRSMRTGGAVVTPGILHGSWLQLVTGLGLVGVIEAGDLAEVDNLKIAVKLLVMVAVVVLAFLNRKKDAGPSVILGVIGGLTLLNIVVAVFWR
ncbi:hypothetical protein BJ994_000528 [Arthrobacter pigmenti]|uniref:Integral membrane protein n=1 Tax=Arthrobacter pigmenti TaxID=271432 RepID=A0A846RLC5_9MICC|nr:hypothetical protein [Arthrobacter pigmenti]NJC21452.1 hypothetical protein [Arthrobacter pigmenti]